MSAVAAGIVLVALRPNGAQAMAGIAVVSAREARPRRRVDPDVAPGRNRLAGEDGGRVVEVVATDRARPSGHPQAHRWHDWRSAGGAGR